MFELTIGNPNRTKQPKPASFSRFVLPFAYKLKKSNDKPEKAWIETKQLPEQFWREKYLTKETQEVLFRHAKWFQGWSEPIKFTLTNQRHIKSNQQTQLVLFEFPFPLLSNQQQAIEMYSLAREAMDIDVLFKEIQ